MKNLSFFDITRIISIIILVLAVFVFDRHTAYGAYTFLRIVVMLSSIYAIFIYDGNQLIQSIFGVLAILYNPIIKIHLARNTWELFNIATIIIFVYSIYVDFKLRE